MKTSSPAALRFFSAALLATVMAMGIALFSGCATPSAMPGHTVNVDGQPYVISALTAGTWTVLRAGRQQALSRTPASKAAMLQAVETLSGCKVTDSDYTQDDMQLDAQVDCAGVKS